MRIAAVPAAHPYVRAVRPPGHVVLPDPPVVGASVPGQWWPPVVLTPAWLREHAGRFDVLHVHFGVESIGVDQLRDVVSTVRALGRPLVHTVHDIEHPHLADQDAHRAQSALLVASADELLTLTDRAADEVEREHGRRPIVVPHPRLASVGAMHAADLVRRRRSTGGPRVGVHVRGLRANVRPGPWIAALAGAVRERGGTTTVVVNDDVRPGTDAHRALDGLRAAVAGAPAELVLRPRPDDAALALELAGLDVSVLPYAHGTHSGWLELCWDLGTGVLAPAIGAFSDQHREPHALQTFDPSRPVTIARALDRLLTARPGPDAHARLAIRARTEARNHAVHADVYSRASVGRSAGHRGASDAP